ncbi:tubulin-tyrosine ligase, partial [Caulochytrium protostelioides]
EALQFDFVCTSYVLPAELALFQEEFRRVGGVWIMKPVGRAQGKGIFLINKLVQIQSWLKKRERAEREREEDQQPDQPYLVQRYIENPYLIGGKKFDLRIYVMVTSYTPLVVYMHRNGFCRFSNTQFSMDAKDISNMYIHATNVAIQKTAPNYDDSKGCKWLLRNFKMYVGTQQGTEAADKLFTAIEALVVRSLMSVQKVMINDRHCFEIYGYDILIDAQLKPWLLEVNASPSISAENQFDYDLKYGMLNDAFDIVDLEGR